MNNYKFSYTCTACRKEIFTKRKNKSIICRPCLARKNLDKALKASNRVTTLREYEAVYRSFIRTAAHKVELTFDDFKEYTKIDACYYCNNKIVWNKKSTSKNGNGIYMRYNLDRKDPSKNYTKDNCVVCCPKCNRTKLDNFNAEEFLQIVKLIKSIRGKW
ncbi:MAG: hypothetical protein PHY47_00030 [Lachnospiraceae bacterium]|nr:hypothetical protein [Lachnospiraceae bacterium]